MFASLPVNMGTLVLDQGLRSRLGSGENPLCGLGIQPLRARLFSDVFSPQKFAIGKQHEPLSDLRVFGQIEAQDGICFAIFFAREALGRGCPTWWRWCSLWMSAMAFSAGTLPLVKR